jgi:hypothetical protein
MGDGDVPDGDERPIELPGAPQHWCVPEIDHLAWPGRGPDGDAEPEQEGRKPNDR